MKLVCTCENWFSLGTHRPSPSTIVEVSRNKVTLEESEVSLAIWLSAEFVI